MLEGNGLHVVSQNVYRQVPVDAISVAPSKLVVALATEVHNP